MEEETEVEEVKESVGEHHLVQRELCSALWSVSFEHAANQQAIANSGGIPQLIALLSDNPEIHREAAGALWSLAADVDNQKVIASEGGIPQLVDLLRTGKKNFAQETAAGALRSLAQLPSNRDLIAQAGGIGLLVPLFDGGTDMAKEQVAAALLT